MQPERVWYVAYGSNVNKTRFLRYLEGDEGHPGARDATHPAEGRFTTAPMHLRFAGESQRWGGGVCFVDPDPAASAYVRAWDITAEQFEDVCAQENRRPIGEPFDWTAALKGDAIVGDSWYSRIVRLDVPFATDDRPAMTFTWATPRPLNPPARAYRETIVAGLAENPDLSSADIEAYLVESGGGPAS